MPLSPPMTLVVSDGNCSDGRQVCWVAVINYFVHVIGSCLSPAVPTPCKGSKVGKISDRRDHPFGRKREEEDKDNERKD